MFLLAFIPFLAITISDQIGVAGITTIGLVLVAIIQNHVLGRKAKEAQTTARDAKTAAELTALHADTKAEEVKAALAENIGTKNGNGNVVDMLEQVLRKMDHVDTTVSQQDKRIVDLRIATESLQMALDAQIKRYDADHPTKHRRW